MLPAAGLLPLWMLSCDKERLPQKQYRGRVIIVGAGAAGLYAAHLLKQHGADVVILEASDRVGGRIFADVSFADAPVERGAEEIHGRRSTWHDMVRDSGGFLNRNTDDFIEADAQLRIASSLKNDADYTSVQDFIRQATNDQGSDVTVENRFREKKRSQRMAHFANAELGNEYGTDNAELSIRGITEEDQLWTSGNGNYTRKSGSLYEVLNKEFADEIAGVVLLSPVTSVNLRSADIQVLDGNGKEFLSDKIIITVPLTQLKKSKISFAPALPAKKLEAIDKIGMGPGMKVHLKFNRRFWAENTGSIFSSGIVPEYWDSHTGRGSDVVLTAFIMGTFAAALYGKTDAEIIAACVDDLDRLYPGQAKTALLGGLVTDWTLMPFIEGAYSFPMVGGGISCRKTLSEPIDNRLFFAGEATHYEGHSATVHGALETAFRAVKELLDGV